MLKKHVVLLLLSMLKTVLLFNIKTFWDTTVFSDKQNNKKNNICLKQKYFIT